MRSRKKEMFQLLWDLRGWVGGVWQREMYTSELKAVIMTIKTPFMKKGHHLLKIVRAEFWRELHFPSFA